MQISSKQTGIELIEELVPMLFIGAMSCLLF